MNRNVLHLFSMDIEIRVPKVHRSISGASLGAWPAMDGKTDKKQALKNRLDRTMREGLIDNRLVASESINTVFISSTFEDLREERAEIQKAILRLGCLPIGMELFPSTDDDAWGYIKGEIEKCDYYILIVGGRYGSVGSDGMSFTEKEYRFAREKMKPCLVFVRSDSFPVTKDKMESDDSKKKKLDEFLIHLNGARLAQRFDSLGSLGRDAYFSLDKLRKEKPVRGYVRGDHESAAGNTENKKAFESLKAEYALVLSENSRLVNENRKLENDYGSHKREFPRFQQMYHDQELELRQCREDARQLVIEHDALKGRFEKEQTENNRLSTDLNQLKAKLDKFQKENKLKNGGTKPFGSYNELVTIIAPAIGEFCPKISVSLKVIFLFVADEIKSKSRADFLDVVTKIAPKLIGQSPMSDRARQVERACDLLMLIGGRFSQIGLIHFQKDHKEIHLTDYGEEQYEILKNIENPF